MYYYLLFFVLGYFIYYMIDINTFSISSQYSGSIVNLHWDVRYGNILI